MGLGAEPKRLVSPVRQLQLRNSSKISVGTGVLCAGAPRNQRPLFPHQEVGPRRQQAISQQHITRTRRVPDLSQQADFSLSFSGIATNNHAENRPTGVRNDGRDKGNRKTEARLLFVNPQILLLILQCVRHRDG